MGKDIGRYFKHNQSKISTPTLKKPIYHINLLIHYMQVIRHGNLSHLNLILKIVLQKKKTTPQIYMTSTHVLYHKKITVFRPHLHPLI